MKGLSKRFVDHKGEPYSLFKFKMEKKKKDDKIGFFGLWRYATATERALTALSVVLAWASSSALISAVVIYGELTALFVARHKAAEAVGYARILTWFGGGAQVPAGNRPLHMDALVDDSWAFLKASVAVMAVQLSLAGLAVFLANTAATHMISRLRWRLLRAVIRQEVAFFDTNTTLNFASSVTEDMEKLKMGVGEHVPMTAHLAGSALLGAALSLLYGWQLTLVALSVVPLAVVVAATVSKYQTICSTNEVTAYGAAGRIVEEALAGVKTVKAYNGEHIEVARYKEALRPATAHAHRRGLLAGAGSGAGWLLTYALNAMVFGYGAVLVVRDMDLPAADQVYHPGVMVTILFCCFMAAQNIAMCNPHLELFSAARGVARSLYDLLERPSKIDAMEDKGIKPASFKGDIEFKDIHFSYPSRPDVKILRGLSLSVRAGETVALVGASGCGKSTLLQLLQRVYDPDAGAVAVDGHRLQDLHIHHYRTSIGVVGQEPVLFSGTIRENITIGLEGVSDQEVVKAASIANAHGFISKLADGYETQLGERGASLSGGQKQRIAIARAVLRRPAVLLLDEPTSALDPAAERRVQAALDAAAAGRTTLVVSHRLSTIRNASRIVYVADGAVAEAGSHADLMALRGRYYQLVQQDLTHKSIETAMQAEKKDLEEEEENLFPEDFSRKSVRDSQRLIRASRSTLLRSSQRITSARAPLASLTPPSADLIEEVRAEGAEGAEGAADAETAAVSTWQLLRLNAAEWPLLAGGGAASFVIGLTMPVFALLFSKVYGMFAMSDKAEILRRSAAYAALFAGAAAVCGAVTFLQTFLFNRAGARLTARLRVRAFDNFLKQEQAWFDRQENAVGALCARLASDCAAVQGATGSRLGTMLQGVSTLVLGVGLALPFSWKMTLVSLVSLPAVIGGIYLEGWVTRRAETAQRRALEAAARVATEAVLHVRTVQALGIESTLLGRYERALGAAARRARSVLLVRGPVYGLCLCAPTFGYAMSLSYGGYLIAREGLLYEYAILVSEALIYGAWMLAEAMSFAPSFAAARRSGARIVAALRRQPAVATEPTATHVDNWKCDGNIDINNVEFSYAGRRPVLRGLRLALGAGRRAALIGRSGCGKSTLAQLLLRYYDPSAGELRLDGRDIRRDIPLPQLRAQFGLVGQEPTLFARTVKENIAYGDTSREVSMEEVIDAAKQANVHDFIISLPLGYETHLGGGGGGAALSGGQKQRIAIARALVRRPRVLLLDEATSALDAHSEKAVQAALDAASAGRTTLMIAHRLATVQAADVIFVIDQGVVAESGSHEELVAKRGMYYDLLQQQAPVEH